MDQQHMARVVKNSSNIGHLSNGCFSHEFLEQDSKVYLLIEELCEQRLKP
jgi:hypothetical protein